MKTFFFFVLAGLGMLFGQDQKVLGKSEEGSYEGKVVRITVGEKDLSNGQSFKFWERTLDRVKDEGAKAVVFDLDTPGGYAFLTGELMTQISDLEVPTVSFVSGNALSAGSMVAISTDRIYMKPGTKIGSTGLVSGGGQEIDPVMRAKLESFFSAHVRYIAEKKGHDPKIMEAMMLLSDEERVIGDVVVKPGQLLALNSKEATKMMDSGTLFAESEMEDIEAVLKKEGWLEENMVTAQPSGFEKIAWWVASVSGVLIMLGLAGGYFELKTPGFGLGGIVSIVAFSIFFFGNYLAGNMAGYELAAIFALGLIFIAIEVFVIPGFGVAGILGLLMVVSSLAFSMVDGVDWRNYQWTGSGTDGLLAAISGPAMQLAFGIFGSLILLFLMMKFLPRVGFVESRMLPGSLAPGTGLEEEEAFGDRVGMTGAALSDLRPSGKVEIDGELLEVMTEGEYVEKGDRVRVISEDGMGIVVKKVPS